MSQFLNDDNDGFGVLTTSGLNVQCDSGNQPRERLKSSTMSYEHGDWVPLCSSESEDAWCFTPSNADTFYPPSPASRHSAQPNSSPDNDSMKLVVAGEHLKEARARERYQALCIKAQEKDISVLKSIIDKERDISDSLGTKLFDLYGVTTQTQQYELDKLQSRLLALQTDAENRLLGQEWRDLQQNLLSLNHKLDGYIKSSTRQLISTGKQTDELTLFMKSLLGDLPKMWNRLEMLERDIEEEKLNDAANKFNDGERTTNDRTNQDVNSANTSTHPSVTDILDRYYEFSRLQRERMAKRKETLQMLLDEISTELGRFQADLTYEEGRTANMRTRMKFWADDLEASKVKCPATLMENLEIKETALKCGSQELEKIAAIIQEVPLYFNMIDIHALGQDHTALRPESSATGTKQASGTARDRAVVTGQREDTLYIAELEAKLEEKQANERAWATHIEKLHQREKEAKAALQKRLDSAELGNAELRKVVKVIAGRLFEHRERLWGLSTPARKLGEELISTLEELEIACDKPLIYE